MEKMADLEGITKTEILDLKALAVHTTFKEINITLPLRFLNKEEAIEEFGKYMTEKQLKKLISK